jgi:hypothetical protein
MNVSTLVVHGMNRTSEAMENTRVVKDKQLEIVVLASCWRDELAACS